MFKFFIPIALLILLLPAGGCIQSQANKTHQPFETEELDACLAIVIDMSGSFATSWEEKAYQLTLQLMDQFFVEGSGGNTRIVLCQLSASDEVVLFEGKPSDLRTHFAGPEDLNQFLLSKSDPGGSQVYLAARRAIDYVSSIQGVTEETRLMTVFLSDLIDSNDDRDLRVVEGGRMLSSLKKYQRLGGGLALYYVDTSEIYRWQEVCREAEFEPGSFLIESSLVVRPQLPRFD